MLEDNNPLWAVLAGIFAVRLIAHAVLLALLLRDNERGHHE